MTRVTDISSLIVLGGRDGAVGGTGSFDQTIVATIGLVVANLGAPNLGHRVLHRLTGGNSTLMEPANLLTKPAISHSKSLTLKANCSYCGAEPAVRSHVIPDSYLHRLDEGNRPPQTGQYDKDGGFEVVSMTGSNTPTFRGYCQEHERTLFPWEPTGVFGGPLAIETQLMRVVDAFMAEFDTKTIVFNNISILRHNPVYQARYSVLPALDQQALDAELQSLEKALKELQDVRHLFVDLRASLQNSARGQAGMLQPAFFHIPIQHVPTIALADVALVPGDGFASPAAVPVAICILPDETQSHLMMASTMDGKKLLSGLESSMRNDPGEAIKHGIHWMLHGSQYWFAKEPFFESLEKDEKEVLRKRAQLARVGTHFYLNAPAFQVPIVRSGNGWI